MKAVLTGASGFLGQAIIQRLKEKGHAAAALVRPDSNRKELSAIPSITLFPYSSLKDPKIISQLKDWRPDVFIHLGWKGITGIDRNQPYQFSENIGFTLDTVQLASDVGCTGWMGIGSQAEYGIADKKISEEAPCKPVSAYGKAKLAAGIASLGMCELLKLNGAWCRVFSVYGPRDNPGYFIPNLITAIKKNEAPSLTACEQQWDYLYIADAANALVLLAEKQCNGIYNIGSGDIVSLKEVAEQIKTQMKSTLALGYGLVPYGETQVMHLQADVSKLQHDTGWKPSVSLEEGLKQTIQYFN